MTAAQESARNVFHVPFAIGDVISNKTLYTAFKCACEGSVRYSSTNQVLVLVNNYADPRHRGGEWRGDILYFTGGGKNGDQDLGKGTNKRLAHSLQTGTPIYYFEVHTQGKYTYRGRIGSAGEPIQKEEPGADGRPRKVWIFPLRLENP